MVQKTSNEIIINPENPKVLNDYLEAVRDDDKERLDSASEELSKYIIGIVGKAIKVLYKNDSILLESEMNEMTICGRLAMYLQEEFKDFKGYYVDTEYYRLKVPRAEANLRKHRIRCDILFHSRGANKSRVDNLLAIEAKLEGNPDDGDKDITRLEDFVMPEPPSATEEVVHSTLVGLFLRFGKKCSVMRVIPVNIDEGVEDEM